MRQARNKNKNAAAVIGAAITVMLSAGFWFMPSGLIAGTAPQSLGSVTLTEVSPRIVTPNGDSFNDIIYFKFDDTLSGLPIESRIYDINGANISDMTMNSTETSFLWDGKDKGGKTVPSGVYIYSIKLGSRRATGTVVVAH